MCAASRLCPKTKTRRRSSVCARADIPGSCAPQGPHSGCGGGAPRGSVVVTFTASWKCPRAQYEPSSPQDEPCCRTTGLFVSVSDILITKVKSSVILGSRKHPKNAWAPLPRPLAHRHLPPASLHRSSATRVQGIPSGQLEAEHCTNSRILEL